MVYTRVNNFVCFLLPTLAIGSDESEGKNWFIELAFLNYVIGFSEVKHDTK